MEVLTYKKLDSKARQCACQNPTLDPDFKKLLSIFDEYSKDLVVTEDLPDNDTNFMQDSPGDANGNQEGDEPSVIFLPEQKGAGGPIKAEQVQLLRTYRAHQTKPLEYAPKEDGNLAREMSSCSNIMTDAQYPPGTSEKDPFLVQLIHNVNNVDLEAVYEQAKDRPKLVREQLFEVSFNDRVFRLMFLHLIVLHYCLLPKKQETLETTQCVDKIISRLFGRPIYNLNEEIDPKLVDTVTRWELEPGHYTDVSPLHVSSFYGDLSMIKCLVRSGADVDLPTTRGDTALSLAVTRPSDQRLPIAKHLIKHGADANLSNEDGTTPLHRAITLGEGITMLELLITKGKADVNAVKKRGLATPLIQATAFKSDDAIDLLLRNNADIAYKTLKKQTVFHYAVAADMQDLVKKLIKTEDDRIIHNESDLAGDTPLILATAEGNLEMMKILLEHEARLDDVNVFGKTVWELAFDMPHREDILDLLVQSHKQTAGYETIKEEKVPVPVVRLSPLHVAARRDDVLLLKQLLDKGLYANESDKKSMDTFLHVAAKENKRLVLGEKFENYDQLLQGLNRNEDTPLHMAARHGDAESMALIMNMATDTLIDDFLHFKNHQDCTPLHVAILRPTKQVAMAIVDKMKTIKDTEEDLAIAQDIDLFGNSYLHAAARYNFPALCEKLLDLNVQIDQRNDKGNTPVHEAAFAGNTEVVKCLLRADSDETSVETADKHQTSMDLHMKNFKERTVLHMAAKCPTATKEMFEIMVTAIGKVDVAGGILNATDYQGNTAVHIAIRKHGNNMYSVLKGLASGNYAIMNGEGDTPLHTAAKSRDPNVLNTVLRVMDEENISKPLNVGNSEGKTPLMLCVESGLVGVLEKMIKDGSDLAFRSKVNGDTVLHDLVRLSVAHPAQIDQWRSIYKTICKHAVKWWCMSNKIEEPDYRSKHYGSFKEFAVKFLTSAVRNGRSIQTNTRSLYQQSRSSRGNFINILKLEEDEGLPVIQLAVKLGASQIFETILNTPLVYRTDIKVDKSIVPRFDVTYVTPDTSKFQERHVPHTVLSCLEILWNVKDDRKIVEFLDITPIKQLSHNYWERYQWIYVVLMFLHILYMSIFSKFALDLQLIPSQNTLGQNHPNISTNATEDNGTRNLAPPFSEIAPFALLLVWPTILALYLFVDILFRVQQWHKNRTSFLSVKKTRHPQENLSIAYAWSLLLKLRLLGNELTSTFGFMFALSVLLWYIFLACGSIMQVYFLVLAFSLGWLFTVAFTKGFETVHSFTVMLKYIIAVDIIRFLVIFSFIFIGFSLALHAIFLHAPSTAAEFSSIGVTFFFVFRVMLSVDDPFSETIDEELNSVGIPSSVPKTMYVIFMVITAIVLLNLLIAMMSDTYSSVKAREIDQWRVSNMKLAVGFDKKFQRLKRYVRFPVQKSFILRKEKTELRPKSVYGSEYRICSERYYAYFYSGISTSTKQDKAESDKTSIKAHFDVKLSVLTETVQRLEEALDKITKEMRASTKRIESDKTDKV